MTTTYRHDETLNANGRIFWFDDFREEDDPERNRFRFLSNFYVGEPIELDGQTFMTGEHLFQAAKATNREDFEYIREAHSPGRAKAIGRRIPLRHDWELVKYDVMAAVIRLKFAHRRAEAGLLLRTGDCLLVEGTYWGDSVWGTHLPSPAIPVPHGKIPPGRNWLGTLLMARRAELRAEQVHGVGLQGAGPNLEFAVIDGD